MKVADYFAVALAITLILCVLLGTFSVISVAQQPTPPKAVDYKVSHVDGWIRLEQGGYRRIAFRDTAITGIVQYEKGRSPSGNHPHVLLIVNNKEYRFDLTSEDRADELFTLVSSLWKEKQ